jgi:hypothetical protein
MEYFGTNLDQHGHYRFVLEENHMSSVRYDYKRGIPFDPECLTYDLPKGEVIFYQGGGFTVIGIAGSCKDDRGGTESIFWVKELITREEMIEKIKQQPMAMKIINAMPFEVRWNPIKPQ